MVQIKKKPILKQGIDLIIVDHHQSKKITHSWNFVNPHLVKIKENLGNFMHGRLTFKMVLGILKKLRNTGNETVSILVPKNISVLVD